MTKQATLQINGSLRDFIDSGKPGKTSVHVAFEMNPSAKDIIESQGIPHTAVFGLMVNGNSKTLDYNVKNGDKIKPLPFEMVSADELDEIQISPSRFMTDIHLGKLSKKMRLLGLDTLMADKSDDQEIISLSNAEQRMILTRDIGLLRNGKTMYGYWIRNTEPEKQAEELFERFELSDHINPFSRCMECNSTLQEVPLSEVKKQVPPKVQEWKSDFYRCSGCGKVYWKGSHYQKLKERVEKLTSI